MHNIDNFNEELPSRNAITTTPATTGQQARGTPNHPGHYCKITGGNCSENTPLAADNFPFKIDADKHYETRPNPNTMNVLFRNLDCHLGGGICWRARSAQNQRGN